LKLLYFAWIRERTGHAEEVIDLPGDIETVGDLIGWLKSRDEQYAHAFENEAVVRVAIDKTHARLDQPIDGASEIAFFPPMTGG